MQVEIKIAESRVLGLVAKSYYPISGGNVLNLTTFRNHQGKYISHVHGMRINELGHEDFGIFTDFQETIAKHDVRAEINHKSIYALQEFACGIMPAAIVRAENFYKEKAGRK